MGFETVLQAKQKNLVSSTLRVSDEYGIDQCGSSLSQPQQKSPELPNCASHYENIVQILIHLCNTITFLDNALIPALLYKSQKKTQNNLNCIIIYNILKIMNVFSQ